MGGEGVLQGMPAGLGGVKETELYTWKKALRNLMVSLPQDWGRDPHQGGTRHPNVACLIDRNNSTKLKKNPNKQPPSLFKSTFKVLRI